MQIWYPCLYSYKEPKLYKAADTASGPAQGTAEPGSFCDGGAEAEHHMERVCGFMWQEFYQVA